MTDQISTPAQMREASIYYIDCEFDGHSGPLLSLAMVRGDGYSTHIRVNLDAKDPWVQANVMPIMDSHNADVSETVDLACVGQSIRDFIGTCQHPTIIADSPVDIWRFCAAISTASDGQWSSVDYPKISFAVHNVACYPTTLAGAVQHNAWWDAMALRDTLCRALPVAEPAPVADGSFYKEVDIDRLQERAEKAEAERDRLRAALDDALVACRIVDAVARAGHEKIGDLVLHMLSAVEPARAALKGDSDE